MKRISLALAASFVAAVIVSSGQAQQPDKVNREDVSFRTIDGVLLKGAFYPSAKGGNSPVVMFLHKLGSNSSTGDWDKLAAKLQVKGFSVLSFDFRGHGKSTVIADPKAFWSYPANQLYVKGVSSNPRNLKKTINLTDIKSNYYIPYLMNDIAAARHDLDNRNDNGMVNASNIILIGAEEGASLGMMWVCTEFYRTAVYQNGLAVGGVVNNNPAGEDIAGAIWLSLRRNPGLTASTSMTFPYHEVVKNTPAVCTCMTRYSTPRRRRINCRSLRTRRSTGRNCAASA
jgi:pimeloyl-ACP methyl ester carboxylesterase